MKVELIENWKKAYKYASVWFFVILGLLPDIYNLAISMNVFDSSAAPEPLARLMNVIAFLGVVARLVKQKVDSSLETSEQQ